MMARLLPMEDRLWPDRCCRWFDQTSEMTEDWLPQWTRCDIPQIRFSCRNQPGRLGCANSHTECKVR